MHKVLCLLALFAGLDTGSVLVSAYSGVRILPNAAHSKLSSCLSNPGSASGVKKELDSLSFIEDRRKLLLNGAAIFSLATIFSSGQPSFATPVRAPLPPGPADPQDKAKLEDIAKYLDAIGPDLNNPDKWPSILEVVNKDPYPRDSLDALFRYAARGLPPNALLGTDAGQWVGVKTEAVDAIDAFLVELNFLQAQRAKGAAVGDTTDLLAYREQSLTKIQEFLALYDNRIESRVLPGFRR